MVNASRTDIYNYLYGLLYGTVTENIYSMKEPQELTDSDTKDGFIVINVGYLIDESEFYCEAYGSVRCYVEAFIPPKSRGRLDVEKFGQYENAINSVIDIASRTQEGDYYIEKDSVISLDSTESSTSDNAYFTFIKSFVVIIDK
jgi:hypothetical protein